MADSTRARRRSIFERELVPHWRNRLLTEITPGDLRAHCLAIVDRGAPATAIHVRDIVIALKTCAGNSRYLLPSRYDTDAPMSRATFNRVTYPVVDQARKDGLPLEPFTVHDLRRTGSVWPFAGLVRHCERSEAIQGRVNRSGLPRCARNDEGFGFPVPGFSSASTTTARSIPQPPVPPLASGMPTPIRPRSRASPSQPGFGLSAS